MSYSLIEINGDNAEDFSDYIDIDMQEELDRVFFKGVGATDESGAPAGALVYELKNSESEEDTTSRIRLLKAKNEDVENELLTEYASVIRDDEVVESFYESSDESMSHYLESNGFSLRMSEALDVAIPIEDIKKISQLIKGRRFPAFIQSLSDVTVLQFRSFIKECLVKGRKGLMDDLAYIPKNWFESDVSACVVTDDKVNGVLLIKKAPSGTMFAVLFTAFGPDYQQNLGLMMAYSAQKITELYPDDATVVIRRHSPMVKKLTDKFFPSRKGEDVYSGNRAEMD